MSREMALFAHSTVGTEPWTLAIFNEEFEFAYLIEFTSDVKRHLYIDIDPKDRRVDGALALFLRFAENIWATSATALGMNHQHHIVGILVLSSYTWRKPMRCPFSFGPSYQSPCTTHTCCHLRYWLISFGRFKTNFRSRTSIIP